MCRHLGYVGEPLVLGRLLYDAPHSLERQSYQARELLEGRLAADGFGVAWYPPHGAPGVVAAGPPLSYRSERPVWGDDVWRALASRLEASVVVSSVRNATDPTTLGLVNVHPFVSGRWAFTHNGFLSGFRVHFLRAMTSRLSDARYAMRSGATDSETLFLTFLDRVDEGGSPADALRSLVREGLERAEGFGVAAQLNLLVSDGERVFATRAGTAGRSNSLYVAEGHPSLPGVVIASEPLDGDGSWRAVPHGSLLEARAGSSVRIESLPEGGGRETRQEHAGRV